MRLNTGVPGVQDLLAQLDDDDLVELLRARPDATSAPQPRNLAELADRLDSVHGLVEVLDGLPLPASQLLEAVLALGEGLTPEQFGARIGHDLSGPAGRWFEVLRTQALVWSDGQGRLQTARSASSVFPIPLGLGPRLADVLAVQDVNAMRHALRELGGGKPPTRHTALVAELTTKLSSPDVVLAIAARAPEEIQDDLRRWAGEQVASGRIPFGSSDEPADWDQKTDWDVNRLNDPFGSGMGSHRGFAQGVYPPLRLVDALGTGADVGSGADLAAERLLAAREAYLRRTDTARWALDHGLAWQTGWNAVAVVPAEVVVALLGDELVVPFETEPPFVPTAPLTAPADAFASVLSATANLAVAVFDRLAKAPLPGLKSGGVGVRELKRLQAELGAETRSLRLVLELIAGIGAIQLVSSAWAPSSGGTMWRETDPAGRILQLLQSWLEFNGAPTQHMDHEGKVVAALAGHSCAGCASARSALLDALGTFDDDVRAEPAALIAFTLWSRPYVHATAEPGEAPFARVLDEAHQLGLTYDVALTDVGRALLQGDRSAALASLRRVLPPTSDQVLIGADLTAVVVGTPSAALSILLDSTADRESTGGAIVWRFTPASVRRALDDGHDAETIVERLSAAATGAIPQSLRYLVGDLARRHGSVRVAGAVSTLHSDDVPLLAEILGDRRLRKLGLRMLAPTVLAADAPAGLVLTTLRAHGYLPMPEDADPDIGPSAGPAAPDQLAELRQLRARAPAKTEKPVDLDRLVRRLRVGVVVAESPSEQGIARYARRLSAYEVRLLAHAADTGGRVAIEYESGSGSLTRRTISAVELFGDAVQAWCELRSAERWFRFDRIRAVTPADS